MKIALAILTALLMIVNGASHAQTEDYFQSSKGILVVKPTLNSSSVSVKTTGSESSATDARLGYGLGIEYWHKFAGTFYVSAGLHYNAFGYKDVRTNYLNAPLVINFLSKSQMLTLGAGVYGGYVLSGKFKNTQGGRTKMKFGERATDNRTRTDAGIIISAGYNLFTLGHFISYAYIGLKDLTPNALQNGTTRKMLSWTVTYAIPVANVLKKK